MIKEVGFFFFFLPWTIYCITYNSFVSGCECQEARFRAYHVCTLDKCPTEIHGN